MNKRFCVCVCVCVRERDKETDRARARGRADPPFKCAAKLTLRPWQAPSPRSHHSAVCHKGKMWIFGGYGGEKQAHFSVMHVCVCVCVVSISVG